MAKTLSEEFSLISRVLCNCLYEEELNKGKVNTLIDELNAKPYKAQLFVGKHDAVTLANALCQYIKPVDEFLVAKTSHLLNCILTRQNLQFNSDYLVKMISWHIKCLKKCSDIILPDILHNMQYILQVNPLTGPKHVINLHQSIEDNTERRFMIEELIGSQGVLLNLIDTNKSHMLSTHNSLQICLFTLKCIDQLVSVEGNKPELSNIPMEVKEHVSEIIVKYLMKGSTKSQDDFLYCKTVISAMRVLSQLYFNDPKVSFQLPEVMGVCRHFVLYGVINQSVKPEKIMPAQQTIAALPVAHTPKGGKKQRLRKQRITAMEVLRKEIPVSDRSLTLKVVNFEMENISVYRPASSNYLEPQKLKNNWVLTSDSDMSDVESSAEAKLIALKSRVRQSATNLLLVLIKVKEKRDIFGYWWALLPDSPDPNSWSTGEGAKTTLAFCAVTDPIASSRASVLSVVLALLSGSRSYLSQAESSKKETTSFIPFSVTLGYIITCMHNVLTGILDSERSHSVIIVAMKCCAALVQATPYHKMKEGLISDLVRSTRKYLVHRDVTLQVGALITMGCVLSVDPKVEEILKAVEKDTPASKTSNAEQKSEQKITHDECDDFEEGYSDDEMFIAVDQPTAKSDAENTPLNVHYFKSWILDICFKNMGWVYRGDEVLRYKPSAIPIILESLQVLSAVAFHHLSPLLHAHLPTLADVLSEMLQHDHQDVVLQSTKTVSIIGDAVLRLEQTNEPPHLNHCIYMWQKLLTPLSTILQSCENVPAKAAVCDCIANIGDRSFKELPRGLQVLCCTLLVGSCSDEEPGVRAAAVRSLAMTVMFRTLRQDIGFVSDCGENILRILAETTLEVRTKGAWALGNLSDALVANMDDPEADDIDDDLLIRLLEASIAHSSTTDKIKMSFTRGLGNLLRLIKDENLLRTPQIKALCETAIENLLALASKASNMKVRWNACYALGNAMRNENMFTCFSGWQAPVFQCLCKQALECSNLKVRINAAAALRAPGTRARYGAHFGAVWRGVMAAMETAANVDDFTEYKHKDNLIEQLCLTLAHMCCLLKESDLADIEDPLVFHCDSAKGLYAQLCHKLPPENASCLKILQAAKYVTVDLTATNDVQSQLLALLQEIFIWDM